MDKALSGELSCKETGLVETAVIMGYIGTDSEQALQMDDLQFYVLFNSISVISGR